MKLLILSDANSIHTQKWVFSLAKQGINVHLFSLFKPEDLISKLYYDLGVEIESPDLKHKIKNLRSPNLSKILYFTALPRLNRLINKFSPTIIHAHYASSYGFLAYMIHFYPKILSVWGSDIYDFPNKNIFYKLIMKKIIHSADSVCSTSKAMKEIITVDFEKKDCHLIPFGVDTQKFIKKDKQLSFFTVGTIKSIEAHNGIYCFIDAASILVHENKLSNIKFLIVGEGSMLKKMKKKCNKLGLSNNFKFTGKVSHKNIEKYFQKLSVFIAVSTRESFGVSILEAASCGVPAITSDVGGLPEVNKNNYTGFVIPANNPQILSKKILKLYFNNNLREKMGFNARERVLNNFDWDENVKKMIHLYKSYR